MHLHDQVKKQNNLHLAQHGPKMYLHIHTLYDNVNICTFCIVFPVTETTAAAATAAPTALLSSALCNVNPQRPVF